MEHSDCVSFQRSEKTKSSQPASQLARQTPPVSCTCFPFFFCLLPLLLLFLVFFFFVFLFVWAYKCTDNVHMYFVYIWIYTGSGRLSKLRFKNKTKSHKNTNLSISLCTRIRRMYIMCGLHGFNWIYCTEPIRCTTYTVGRESCAARATPTNQKSWKWIELYVIALMNGTQHLTTKRRHLTGGRHTFALLTLCVQILRTQTLAQTRR